LTSRHHKNILEVIKEIINIKKKILIVLLSSIDKIEIALASRENDITIGQGLGETR
jgi:hypothetical protein